MSKCRAAGQSTPAVAASSEVLAFREQLGERSELDELVREGARRMLQAAIDAEVSEFVARHRERVDDQGRRLVVRNGSLPAREVLTPAGPIEVRQGRVRDNTANPDERVRFTPSVLPAYLRRTAAIEELNPVAVPQRHFLRGIPGGFAGPGRRESQGTQPERDRASQGAMDQEYEEWERRDLTGKQYVYVWADGIHAKVRLADEANKRQCMLVVMGATADGVKELLAVQDGYREDEESWKELLLDLKQRGLTISPKVAVGDGALGFWAALRKVMPETREQRCWVHKTANVLSSLPKSVQPRAKQDLHEIWQAATRENAHKAFDDFLEKWQAKYPAACAKLTKDREQLLTFYDFPAEHWAHLRTTNPIESTFATIRLRHRTTKGSGTRRTSLAMMFKLAQSAAKRWRRLRSHEMIVHVVEGRTFVDGVMQVAAA